MVVALAALGVFELGSWHIKWLC